MKADKILMTIGLAVILVLGGLILYKGDMIGVSGQNIEQNARKEQNVDAGWEVAQAVDEKLGAVLFYDEAAEQYCYSVYLKKNQPSVGYFYREGGNDPYIEEGVRCVVYEDTGMALLSLNREKVASIVVADQNGKETIQVDPNAPFTVVLPLDCQEIAMFDAAGNDVSVYVTYKG